MMYRERERWHLAGVLYREVVIVKAGLLVAVISNLPNVEGASISATHYIC